MAARSRSPVVKKPASQPPVCKKPVCRSHDFAAVASLASQVAEHEDLNTLIMCGMCKQRYGATDQDVDVKIERSSNVSEICKTCNYIRRGGFKNRDMNQVYALLREPETHRVFLDVVKSLHSLLILNFLGSEGFVGHISCMHFQTRQGSCSTDAITPELLLLVTGLIIQI